MSFFEMIPPAALFGEITQEAPAQVAREAEAPPAEPDAIECALLAQASLLRAGFTERQALAGALDVLAYERPMVRNINADGKPTGRARRLAQKRSRVLRQVAATIAMEDYR